LFSTPSALGWPVTAPPQVPAEHVTVLRRAFDAMIKDPEFVAEAQRLRLTVSAVNGETLQKIVHDTVATPPAIIEAAKVAITAKDVVKGSIAKPGGASGSE
jgi:tripartite-type tricarboxylate transporter receptor subunit TctC